MLLIRSVLRAFLLLVAVFFVGSSQVVFALDNTEYCNAVQNKVGLIRYPLGTLGDPTITDEVRMPRVNEAGELIRVKPPEGRKTRSYKCDIPYRELLPKKINNLLLAGECLSCTHEWFYGYRLIPWCMRTGEVAATAAVMALKQRITPKQVKWTSGYFTDTPA